MFIYLAAAHWMWSEVSENFLSICYHELDQMGLNYPELEANVP